MTPMKSRMFGCLSLGFHTGPVRSPGALPQFVCQKSGTSLFADGTDASLSAVINSSAASVSRSEADFLTMTTIPVAETPLNHSQLWASASAIVLGARYLSRASFASAASLLAVAARSFAWAARSPARAALVFTLASAVRKYSSFTLPIQTTNTVEAAPATRLAISTIFATLYVSDATASDGHILIPPWFPLLAIALIFASGALLGIHCAKP